jgi:hypothetical protein
VTAKYVFLITRKDTYVVLNFVKCENLQNLKMSNSFLIFTHDVWYRFIHVRNLNTSLLVLTMHSEVYNFLTCLRIFNCEKVVANFMCVLIVYWLNMLLKSDIYKQYILKNMDNVIVLAWHVLCCSNRTCYFNQYIIQ